MKFLKVFCVISIFMLTQTNWARTQTIIINDVSNPSTIITNIASGDTFTFDVLHTYASNTSLSASSNTVRALGLRLFFDDTVLEYTGTSFNGATKVYDLDYQGNTQISPTLANDPPTTTIIPSSTINNTDNDSDTNKQITTIWASDTGWGVPQNQRLYTAQFRWKADASKSITYINFATTAITNGFAFVSPKLEIQGQAQASSASILTNLVATTTAGDTVSFDIALTNNGSPANLADLTFAGSASLVDVSYTISPQGTLAIDYTPTTAGSNTIAIYLDGVGLIGSTQTIFISPAAFDNIDLSAMPDTVVVGSTETITVTATLRDEFDNTITSSNSDGIVFTSSSATILPLDTATDTITANTLNGIAVITISASDTMLGTATIMASFSGIDSNSIEIEVNSGFSLDVNGNSNIDSEDTLLVYRYQNNNVRDVAAGLFNGTNITDSTERNNVINRIVEVIGSQMLNVNGNSNIDSEDTLLVYRYQNNNVRDVAAGLFNGTNIADSTERDNVISRIVSALEL